MHRCRVGGCRRSHGRYKFSSYWRPFLLGRCLIRHCIGGGLAALAVFTAFAAVAAITVPAAAFAGLARLFTGLAALLNLDRCQCGCLYLSRFIQCCRSRWRDLGGQAAGRRLCAGALAFRTFATALAAAATAFAAFTAAPGLALAITAAFRGWRFLARRCGFATHGGCHGGR